MLDVFFQTQKGMDKEVRKQRALIDERNGKGRADDSLFTELELELRKIGREWDNEED